MTSASIATAYRRLHRISLSGVPQATATTRLADRPPARGVRSVPGFRLAESRDEEWRRTDIRAFKLESSLPVAADEPGARDSCGLRRALEEPELALRHRHRARQRRSSSPGRSGQLGRGSLRRPGPAVKRPSRAGSAGTCMTDAVKPADDVFAALHAAFWTGGTLLYVPKGVKVEAPLVQPGRAGPRRPCRLQPHACRARGRCRGHARPRDGQRRPGRNAGPCTSVRSRSFRAKGRGSGWSTSRTGMRRPGTSAASGPWSAATRPCSGPSAALGSRLSKVNQEVALTGQGAERPGQRRHVHHRARSTWPISRGKTTGPPHHQRPALQRRVSRIARGSSGKG